MEFLPKYYAGKEIGDRLPHAYYGQLDIDNETQGVPFEASTFNENASLPFEIHRMKVRVTMLDGGVQTTPIVTQLSQETILDYIKMMVKDTDLDYQLLKVKTPPSMVQRDDTGFWEWTFPHTIVRSTGIEVEIDNELVGFTLSVDPEFIVDSLRIRVSFEGYKLVLGPPSPLESMKS